ncbi:MAG: DNA replication and repair protein RecF [Ignavibacteria bacterium]|nr:DNA replication and repair protein RecF [Ignavibacteria bacterium]
MYLKYVFIENVRNHSTNKIFFEPNINIIFGPNGSGKTSILEAVSIATFSKSFVTKFDQNIVRKGQNYYSIELMAISDNKIPIVIDIYYHQNKGKEIKDTSDKVIPSFELIGKIPIVILSPDMKNIVFGPPSVRREFVDKIISQIDNNYLKKLIEYKRILKQRNKLLTEIASGDRKNIEILPFWNNKLIETATTIIKRRSLFIDEFSLFFANSYNFITNGKETIDFRYAPFGMNTDEFYFKANTVSDNTITTYLYHQLEKFKQKELERGTTLFGPQKDDFIIKLCESTANEVASQGQSKSILVALKYAEILFLKKQKGTNPIVLFDDIFSELDLFRVQQVLNLMNKTDVQLLVTMTEINHIKEIIHNFETYGIFKVENGKVEKSTSFS